MKKISIVIPIFNEEKNIRSLYNEIAKISKRNSFKAEIVFIDDCSSDKSLDILHFLKKRDNNIKVIEFLKNSGQTAAFDAGIKSATGEIIVTMDGDLQNDPADIPLLIKHLNKNVDVVCGWRKKRKDSLSKRVFSILANWLRRNLTGEKIHDSGCSLRVYKKEVFEGVDLYGEMHRFIPAILSLKGYRIGEIPVNHRARGYGKSKYNLMRIFKGLFDLFFVVFFLRFASRPLHVFGALGSITFLAGLLIGIYLSWLKLFLGEPLSNRPLLNLSVLLIGLGVQFFIFGILAEILIRIYFKTHSMTPYTVRNKTL